MRKYHIYSMIIILFCVFISVGIIITSFGMHQELQSAQKSVNEYQERMSNPVNALDPDTGSGDNSFLNAQLIIPKLNITCQIRTDTVNAYDAVYHYPESVMPGKPGECGILGHRTNYSGLFENIGSLEVGDQVIIKDFTANKNYVYKVSSNGDDIRWDYKTNPIRFAQEGEARLLLTTCYPPGRKDAAWITHCTLVSNETL